MEIGRTTAGGCPSLIEQVALYCAGFDVTNCFSGPRQIEQVYCVADENQERAVLRQLLGQLDLEVDLIQADALHTQKPFLGSFRSRRPAYFWPSHRSLFGRIRATR